MGACVDSWVDACVWVRVCMCVGERTFVCGFVRVCVWVRELFVCVCVHLWARVDSCVGVCMCVCVYVWARV